MEYEPKVGDRITIGPRDDQHTEHGCDGLNRAIGQEATIRGINLEERSGFHYYLTLADGSTTSCYQKSQMLPLNTKEVFTCPNYILECNTGVEKFVSVALVKARIKELTSKPEMKLDSLRLYHISKVEKVELSTAISFKAIDQKPAPRKRAKKV